MLPKFYKIVKTEQILMKRLKLVLIFLREKYKWVQKAEKALIWYFPTRDPTHYLPSQQYCVATNIKKRFVKPKNIAEPMITTFKRCFGQIQSHIMCCHVSKSIKKVFFEVNTIWIPKTLHIHSKLIISFKSCFGLSISFVFQSHIIQQQDCEIRTFSYNNIFVYYILCLHVRTYIEDKCMESLILKSFKSRIDKSIHIVHTKHICRFCTRIKSSSSIFSWVIFCNSPKKNLILKSQTM